ncbi:high frequency lysogenization protein HflD [Denitrificimonas sp. JX-1]|uniref:High frequency lysogenization protein HflD homolog n=1 Tax=Denitrificimonas halotolerans TaxID=3098930 RepID=A0ABU5GQ94_9GAMM|nr:high frequency lysogenization protein HflD [Denitrificimonas sp. JX-1]MDY7219172.1 high frequency lysogenization protein HflD [Denitrificimonas sp. JX-1]
MTPLQEQITALGGVFQAAALVNRLAHTGQISDAALSYMLQTLLVRNPQTTLDVYGGDDLGLREGYKLMLAILERETDNLPRESLRYVVSMLSLERQFARRTDLLDIASKRLPQIEQQVELYGLSSENIASSFGSLYQDTISTFKQRIQVHGDMRYLQQEATAAKVRALLFAGIRSARLWRQLGGRRWHLLTKRSKMLNELHARHL